MAASPVTIMSVIGPATSSGRTSTIQVNLLRPVPSSLDLGRGVVVGQVEAARDEGVGEPAAVVIDADQLFLGHGAVEEGDQAPVVGHHLAVGYEAPGQSLMQGAKVSQRLPSRVGFGVDGDVSNDGGHVSLLQRCPSHPSFHAPITGESNSFLKKRPLVRRPSGSSGGPL